MREIRTEIEISAPISKVWGLLTNFDNWKDWNPMINQASGAATKGSTLSFTMCGKNGKNGPKYSPIVTICEEPRLFRWRVKMLAGFLFTNDRIFELEETSAGTRLTNIEAFSGIMAAMSWGKLNKFVPSMLNSMNEALKKLAEKNAN